MRHPFVRFKIIPLRRRGRRLSLRDARNASPGYVGRLVTHVEEAGGWEYKVTRLQPDDPLPAGRMPELWEAVLVGFAPLAFRLRGYERMQGPDGEYSVVQEWHVEEP